ncbi:MAG TPA: hypothetical protein VH572_08725 [Gaiella sp.]
MKDELERVPIPGEPAAAERAWRVVAAAHATREPVTRRRTRLPAAAIALAAVALLAGVFATSPGRAVLDEIREVVGVERAQPALFSLPTGGRLLVSSDAGVWVVSEDGSKRLLGEYREASWSPLGRFVVAARRNELAALEPDGDVRWTLARAGVRSPRWAGTERDTRIAYADRTGIRVVAGDGTGDRLVARRIRGPLAWRPGDGFVLAYAPPGKVVVVEAETGRVLWQRPRPPGAATVLEWSSDGRRLLVLMPHAVRVYDARGAVVDGEDPSEGWPDVAAAFRPGTHEAAIARRHGSQSTAYVLGGRSLFNGAGTLRGLAWSPDGRWLLVTWPSADQWVFVRSDGRRIRAASNVSAQFRTRSSPRVEGWCCAE